MTAIASIPEARVWWERTRTTPRLPWVPALVAIAVVLQLALVGFALFHLADVPTLAAP